MHTSCVFLEQRPSGAPPRSARERRGHQNASADPGFTLVEILVTIAIIGLLSTMSIVAVNFARTKARDSRARGDLAQMRTAIQLLEQDTGKWPNGCPPWSVKNPEAHLSAAQAGIAAAPSAASQGDGCIWTATETAKWEGPYSLQVTDPWGQD